MMDSTKRMNKLAVDSSTSKIIVSLMSPKVGYVVGYPGQRVTFTAEDNEKIIDEIKMGDLFHDPMSLIKKQPIIIECADVSKQSTFGYINAGELNLTSKRGLLSKLHNDDWALISTQQFFNGYDEIDEIYDEV